MDGAQASYLYSAVRATNSFFFVLTHAQVGGRGGFDLNFHVFSVEACGVSLGGGATSADLGDSSNDSNESFED
tara:strand:- start:301 stop:519 length:219 start_codon:yes stop_codon:yes gene_type:complete